ncbi:hypothetical protein JOD47_001994 [Arthrobacter tumbae]|nr:hypothetical protein [Arthrobacter tumbae]
MRQFQSFAQICCKSQNATHYLVVEACGVQVYLNATLLPAALGIQIGGAVAY